MSEEVKEQLADAATHTTRAYVMVRRSRQPDTDSELTKSGVVSSESTRSPGVTGGSHVASNEVLLVKPILRFLQLLCENHNRDLQVNLKQHTVILANFRPSLTY